MIVDTLADAGSPVAQYGTWAGVGVALVLGVWNIINSVRTNKRQEERTKHQDQVSAEQRKQAEAAHEAEDEARRKEFAEQVELWKREFQLQVEHLETLLRDEERKKRQQARKIKVRHKETKPDQVLWEVCVCNYSGRPIRIVRAGIRIGPEKYAEPFERLGPSPLKEKFPHSADDCKLEWLNSLYRCVFIFPVEISDVRNPDIAVRFIDDEENEWQMSDGQPPRPPVEADWPA